MSRDAERLLKFIVDEAKRLNVTSIGFNIKEVHDIHNSCFTISKLFDELIICGMLSNYIMTSDGNVGAYLTSEGISYFELQKKYYEKKGSYNNIFHGEFSADSVNTPDDNTHSTNHTEFVNYEKIRKIANEIIRYEDWFDDAYSSDAEKVKDLILTVLALAEQKREPQKIIRLLNLLRELSIEKESNLIAAGITSMLSTLKI